MGDATRRRLVMVMAVLGLSAGEAARADLVLDFTIPQSPTVRREFDFATGRTVYSEVWTLVGQQAFPSPAGLSGDLIVNVRTPAGTELVSPPATSSTDIDLLWIESGAANLLLDQDETFSILGAGGSAPGPIGRSVRANGSSSDLNVVVTGTRFGGSPSPFSLTGLRLVAPDFMTLLAAAAPGATRGPPPSRAILIFQFSLPGDHTSEPLPPAQSHLTAVSAVPEPSTLTLLGTGGVVLAGAALRRRTRAAT